MADGSRSSLPKNQAVPAPEFVRWLLPSVADLIFIALLSTVIFTQLSVRLLGDAGIGWHIRTGQQILTTHAIPRVDPFSSTMSGRPWFVWEWLYDVLVGKLNRSFALNGVVWFTAVVIAATFGGLFHFLIRRGANLLPALALVLLAISASMIHFLARPHVVSWLLTLIWLWILDSTEWKGIHASERPSQRRIWILPPLMVVWANLHGGFLIGFVLLAIYWLGALWSWRCAKSDRLEELLQSQLAARRAVELTAVGTLSAFASLVNPYGWRLHAHIYSYLTNRFLMDHIEEFQSPNFHGIAQRCFLILMLTAIAIAVTHRSKLRLVPILLLLFAIYSGLYASRNIPTAAIILVMIVGPLTSSGWRFAQRMTGMESRLRGHFWPVAAVVLTFSILAAGGRLGSQQIVDAHFDPKRMPDEAVSYLASARIQGPILSPDIWGGYLIYRLYPGMQVVVDDRHDLYGAEFFKSYLKMLHVEDGWQNFLQATHPGCVLLPRNTALANMLRQSAGWKATYEDDVAIAFVPTSKP